MKKNYLKGIMKLNNVSDEAIRFNLENTEEISCLPCFESEGETTGTISSFDNDGVSNGENNK